MKRKLINVAIILVVLIIFVTTIYFLFIRSDDKEVSKKTGTSKLDEIISNLVDENATAKDLEELTGIKGIKPSIILGEDSDLQAKPSSDVIKEYDLKKYEKMQKKYVDKIEKAFLKNLNYKLTTSTKNENGDKIQKIELTGFYYQQFITDWSALSIKILEQAGYDLKKLETDTNTQVKFYQAKVKALEIMDSYVKNYENNKEKITFTIICVKGEPKDSTEMLNLLSNLRGMAYSNMNFTNQKNLKNHEERVTKYFDTAKSDNVLNEKSPLKLK